MNKYTFDVTMTYQALGIEVQAETYQEAVQTARDMAGDGLLLRHADISDVEVDDSVEDEDDD